MIEGGGNVTPMLSLAKDLQRSNHSITVLSDHHYFFFAAFVLLELVSPNILIISTIDIKGGIWTYSMLRTEGHFKRNKLKTVITPA